MDTYMFGMLEHALFGTFMHFILPGGSTFWILMFSISVSILVSLHQRMLCTNKGKPQDANFALQERTKTYQTIGTPTAGVY